MKQLTFIILKSAYNDISLGAKARILELSAEQSGLNPSSHEFQLLQTEIFGLQGLSFRSETFVEELVNNFNKDYIENEAIPIFLSLLDFIFTTKKNFPELEVNKEKNSTFNLLQSCKNDYVKDQEYKNKIVNKYTKKKKD